jgi:hypothetical protein
MKKHVGKLQTISTKFPILVLVFQKCEAKKWAKKKM